jgi:hypothetical protein
LGGEAARVLSALNRHGIAMTSAPALLGPHSCFPELAESVDRLEQDLAALTASRRPAASQHSAIGRKTFVFPLLGERPVLDPRSIYARFALQKPILQIANAYFGMYTRLRYYNIWHTFTTQGRARESQLWHQDREDHLILKVFVYLSDVDLGSGPFTYAAGTHPKGKIRRTPSFFIEGNVKRSEDQQMAEVVPREQWVTGVGSRGTIIFADTRGHHKGGFNRERDRIMYTCMFTSHASHSEEFLERPATLPTPEDKEISYALATLKRTAGLIQRAVY